MDISVFFGDLTDAPAEALCTSTNPRLSLMMGTGGAVRDRGGYSILRECEAIVERERRRTGGELLPGSVHVTSGGLLPHKRILHCVASDGAHVATAESIRLCVANALAAADLAGCATVAMPLFGTGHARFASSAALDVMLQAIRESPSRVREVILVVRDASVRLPDGLAVRHSDREEPEDPGWFTA